MVLRFERMGDMRTSALRSLVSCYARALLCVFVSVVLVLGMTPCPPMAYAASTDKADSAVMQLSGQTKRVDVTKEVATLDSNMGKGTTISFDVTDDYNKVSSNDKRRRLVFEDASGKQTQLCDVAGDKVEFKSDQLVVGQKLKLITLTKDKSGNLVKRYEQQLNVRTVDTKKAEQKPTNSSANSAKDATAGISADGSSWSFSNGLSYTFKNTGFKFLDGSTMTLGLIKLPIQYKHNTDGTTIAGINCSPDDVAFFKAVKNGNVWQKFTTEEVAKKTAEMDKGFSGKKLGTWGGKALDWNICGYMEFNTKEPNAPRALNLIISMGGKFEGHAQYLIFTGTITFTIGGKATIRGTLTPGQGVKGKFGLGCYAGLELYAGLGLQYVASVGAYGKGTIDVDFEILPNPDLDSIMLSGEMGVKAKAFGFTLYTWKIISGKKSLYSKPKAVQQAHADELKTNADGTATSPFNVSADTAYPVDSREYLTQGSSLGAGTSDALTTQEAKHATTILKGIYGETELSCATTKEGPVIAYIADAKQVNPDSTRDDVNRSVLVYSRLKDGAWTDPKIIDTSKESGNFADYTPRISTDGENCYVAWLAAKDEIKDGATIGDVGKKLDVKVATITKNDEITVETVQKESDNADSMPASPEAVKVGNDLYVGWYTNQTSGSSGEVIGVSGEHAIRLYKRQANGGWAKVSEAKNNKGAVTSFDVGVYGGKAACAWSLDENFTSESVETSLNSVNTLASSTVYTLLPDTNKADIVAVQAGNAQFAQREGADVLTYVVRNDPNDGETAAYLSINSSSSPGGAGELVLDGTKVFLPTSYYTIAGDLGKGREGNVSFLAAQDGTSDIQTIVTTGAGSADWTPILEATADTAVVTDYCATYANGLPLFIYTTANESAANGGDLSTQAADDGSVDMNQTTEDSLKHLTVNDVDYDEYEVSTGQVMPVTVDYLNDGMLDVAGADLWKLENGEATKVASNDTAVAIGESKSISFNYTVPPKDTFTKAREFTLYVAPKDAMVTAEKIEREKAAESAMTASLGAASLALETTHKVVDGQESIVATVKNDGVVPQDAKLMYLNSDTGEELQSVQVAKLGENEEFTDSFDAPNGYFQNDGIKNIIVTLEDDGTYNDGYEINNTEFISTWELLPEKAQTPKTNATTKATPAPAKLASTGDQVPLMVIVALMALAIVALAIRRVALARVVDEADDDVVE